MNEQPLVTIVTPSFNQAQFLPATIESVLAQTYPHIEYFIIDGGSTDGSAGIIEQYADRLAGWVSEPDQGQTDAINKGFARANGQFLAWLNSDDTYQPHAVAQAVQYLDKHPQVGLVYGDAYYIDAQGNTTGVFPAAQTDYKRLRRGYVHIPQQSAFWRADLWKQVGPLDPSFQFAMDYDLWVRLAAVSEIKYLAGRFWANFRLHGGAKSFAIAELCWPEMVRVHYREGGTIFAPIVFKKHLRRWLRPIIKLRMARRLQGYSRTDSKS
jgi:glycosyltransferase involved in cell wall biosynthesis